MYIEDYLFSDFSSNNKVGPLFRSGKFAAYDMTDETTAASACCGTGSTGIKGGVKPQEPCIG
ncbi:MAG TPA: hypothetical protein GXX48_06060 [Ochrobactrum intermedium]|uniref:Uncharacterized protein n=1 Tax=Brucella intermedia TaxID=94625 RepID=A0A7V6TYR6_9HYPH|nr:hypothetical protein [Brucella intermedia]HHV67191.1 hypothetical protein [Brucella intermedia]